MASATPLTNGKMIEANMHNSLYVDEDDYFKFNAYAGEEVTIKLSNFAEITASYMIMRLEFSDGSGNTLLNGGNVYGEMNTTGDDIGTYTFVPATTDTYYIKLYNCGLKSCDYSIGYTSNRPSPSKVNLTSVENAAKGVKLTWDAADKADGYQIYRKLGTGKYKRVTTLKDGSRTSWTDKKAVNGKKYTYKVRAFKKYGDATKYGKYSKAKKIVFVERVVITSLKSTKSNKVVLKLKKNSKVDGYTIAFIKKNSEWEYDYITKKKVYKKTISGLDGGKRYTFSVCAWKKVDGKTYYSEWSADKKIKVKK